MERGSIKTNIIGLIFISLLPVLGLLITLAPMNSNAVVELPFLNDSPYTKVLAFGGFPDCSTACPLTLTTLRETYLDYQQNTNRKDVGVVFLNIRRDMPEEISRSYIKNFHSDFEAYSTKTSESKLLYTSLALKTFTEHEKITSHEGFIYIFNYSDDKWRIEKIYKNDVDKHTLLKYLTNKTV